MASASDCKASAIGTDTEILLSKTPVVIDLIACGQTKRNSLVLELDRLLNLVSGMTHIDSNHYLAALESLETGKSDLKRFIPLNPKHPLSLIAMARLEEWEGKLQAARKLINRGCLEYPNCEYMWLEACRLAVNPDEAKAVIAEGVRSIPNSVNLWLQAAKLENIDTNKILVLKKGVRCIPDSVRLYKALAKLSNDDDTSVLLNFAVEHYPFHVEMWFALEHNDEKAKLLLDKARQRGVTLAKACDIGVTKRVWMKSALVERELGKTEEERELLLEGLKHFPSFYKLWLMLGQLEDRLAERAKKQGQYEKWQAHKIEAKSVYRSGLERCPNCIPLWLSLAKIEKETSDINMFRSVLTIAQEKNPKNPELLLASLRAEVEEISKVDPFQQRLSKREVALWVLRSLQECPKSGILWANIVDIGPPHLRQIRCGVALAVCKEDPHVLATAAKILWAEGSVDDGRMVLNSVVTAFPDIGDFWALFYKLELLYGTQEYQKNVLMRCVAAKPKHGEKWQAVSKAIENSRKPTEFILNQVAIRIEI